MLWSSEKSVKYFKNKQPDDFFLSEKVMLERVASSTSKILDIGCASGRLIEILNCIIKRFEYTGLDIVQEQIENARQCYPEHTFLCDDVKNINYLDKFDLVNATGVFLHYPDYEMLLDVMVTASRKYVLFDVKFANIDEHLIDLANCYSEIDGHKQCYIIYSPDIFLDFLKRTKGIEKIEIYGYPTKTNSLTVIPQKIGQIYSAGVLLTKNKKSNVDAQVDIDFRLANKTHQDFSFLKTG